MGVDVYMKWPGKLHDSSVSEGYARGCYGASKTLFAECWPQQYLDAHQREQNGEHVARIEDPDPTAGMTYAEADAYWTAWERDKWKPFPVALLDAREGAAREAVRKWVERDMKRVTGSNDLDPEEVQYYFLQHWLPYKRLLKTARAMEVQHGKPVEVWVSY